MGSEPILEAGIEQPADGKKRFGAEILIGKTIIDVSSFGNIVRVTFPAGFRIALNNGVEVLIVENIELRRCFEIFLAYAWIG